MELSKKVLERVHKRSSSKLMIYLFIKRMSDIVFSFLLLLLFTPIMFLIMFLIYKKEGKPVFVTKQGYDKNDQPFDMVTFRLKSHPSDVIRSFPPQPIFRSDNKRISIPFRHEENLSPIMTPTGHWLSRYKLHKLPLLLYVLAGDMSFIGTKMPIVKIIEHCQLRSIKPLPIKQGIIGYSNTKLELPENNRQLAEADLYYLEHCSSLFDMKVFFLFLMKLFRRRKQI